MSKCNNKKEKVKKKKCKNIQAKTRKEATNYTKVIREVTPWL